MARRPEVNQVPHKEIWDHFIPEEMEAFAAYVYAFDEVLPALKTKLNKDKDTGELTIDRVEQKITPFFRDSFHEPRAWTVLERFRRAYMTLDRKMKENPHQKRYFKIADIEADGEISSGNAVLDPRLRTKSKEVWDSIFSKDGRTWGDEEKLKGYVKGHGGDVCRAYGFKEVDIPPVEMEVAGLSGMEFDEPSKTPARASFADVATTEEPKHRGRTRKTVEA